MPLAEIVLKIVRMTKDDAAKLVSNDLDPFGEQLLSGLRLFKVEIMLLGGRVLEAWRSRCAGRLWMSRDWSRAGKATRSTLSGPRLKSKRRLGRPAWHIAFNLKMVPRYLEWVWGKV